jgi:CubicO group peptidase (beta-lactamase class C family)
MRRAGLSLLLSSLTVTSTSAAAVHQPSASTATFERKADALDASMKAIASSGGSYVLSYRWNDRDFSRAYGSLDCAGTRPMRVDVLFDGGSLTKIFTTAAIFKLVEEGSLKLDDRMSELFRDVPPDKAHITVAQLMQHRSGIPNFIDDQGRSLAENEWVIETYDYAPRTKAEMLRLAWQAPLQYPPGTSEYYSNYGFNLLGAVIEQVSGQPYEAYVRGHVLGPLGMAHTGYLMLERRGLPIAEQCRDGRSWGDPYGRGLWKQGVSWHLMGAGGMYTTASDLQKWTVGIASGVLFRPDIGRRFDSMLFGPSYRCGTDAAAVGGSNGMTRSLVYQLPRRGEAVVIVATHRQHGLPDEAGSRAALCGQ